MATQRSPTHNLTSLLGEYLRDHELVRGHCELRGGVRDGAGAGVMTMRDSELKIRSSSYYWALAMGLLLATLYLWLEHHLGWGIKESFLVTALIPTFAAAITTVHKTMPRKHEHERLGDRLRRALTGSAQRLVTPAPVLTFAVILAAFMASYSSVTVLVGTADGQVTVVLSPLEGGGADTLEVRGITGRATVMTNPFGRRFKVEAAGYLPGVFEVFPVTGLRVRLGHDLTLAPSVLIRPTLPGLQALGSGGRIKLFVKEDHSGGPETTGEGGWVFDSDSTGRSSYLIGVPRAIDPRLIEMWERELVVWDTANDLSDRTKSKTILEWHGPTQLTRRAFQPGTRLRLEVRSAQDTLKDWVEFDVGNEPLMDVPMKSSLEEGG